MSKRHTEKFKQEVFTQYKNGKTAAELCAACGIARSTLFLWVKQYSPDECGQIPREQYLLQKELERLREENRIFRESGCSPASPLDVRLSAIKMLKEKYSIHRLCDVLEVPRTTYYYHERRLPEKTLIELEDENLKPLILAVFEKSNGCFGARRIKVKLSEAGYTASERRVIRLMKELSLSSKGSKPKLNSANDRQYQYYPNKLKRKFMTPAPNMAWVSDITYAKVGMDFMYLCVIIDLFSRKVISYEISENIDTELAAQAFKAAFECRGKPKNLVFHSDQGSQYTAFEFRVLLKELAVEQSFSAPGTPHDNAVAESFFASIKKEDFRRNYYKTAEEFREAVDKYIAFYNDYRPHQRLGFRTPNRTEAEYVQTNNFANENAHSM